jgi:hypothetical protein
MAVHYFAYCTVKNPQNPVASINEVIYTHTHKGWMSLAGMEYSLPHNPSVPGSSPGCSNFSGGKAALHVR